MTLVKLALLSAILGLVSVAACNDDLIGPQPDETAPPPPVVGPRAWSTPSKVSAAPVVDSRVGTTPVAFGAHGQRLALLVNIPQDDRLPHVENRLGVMHYDGSDWHLTATMAGSGRNWPATLISSAGSLHLFWAGHLEEEQEAFERGQIGSTQVYHCIFTEELCRREKSFRASDHGILSTRLFGRPVINKNGDVHVTSFSLASKHVVIGPDGGLRREEDLGARAYANMDRDGDEIILVFGGPPTQDRKHIIYIERFDGANWSQMRETFWGGEGWDAHYPRVRVDSDGLYHLAVFVKSPLGRVRLLYLTSRDQAKNWSEPVIIFEHHVIYFGGPQILFTDDGMIHLFWRHPGATIEAGLNGIDNFLATNIAGTWSEPVKLFTSHQPTSELHLAVDHRDVIHAAWTHFNEMYHAEYR